MTTIYLSSTYEDLKDYRKAVFDALSKVSHYKVIAMENYVATDKRPVEKCLQDVANSDLYIGFFGFRYGYIPPTEHNNPNGLSITELEFHHARSLEIPYLIFVAKTDSERLNLELVDAFTGDGNKGEKIKGLRNFLCEECMATFFSSPYELANDVQAAVAEKLEELKPLRGQLIKKAEPDPTITWDIEKRGSPYPGLMHFTRKFAPVFFGRETEVREILDRLYAPEGRFIIISGNSGSGKSSLVDAGVLPLLEEKGLANGKSCRCVRMVPSQGTDPFDALKGVLQSFVVQAGRDPKQVGKELLAGPEKFAREIQAIVTDGINADELVLFLDQMEELFVQCDKEQNEKDTKRFLMALYNAAHESPLRVIATLRADFLHYCHNHSEMLKVFTNSGHYPLGHLPSDFLADVIEKPARCAGLTIARSLVNRIIQDAGNDPRNLPLMAFVLELLFDKREGNILKEEAYKTFGGIQGAIEAHIKTTEKKLTEPLLTQVTSLFQTLVVVNLDKQATRRRAVKAKLSSELNAIADHLIKSRLLTTDGEGEESTISIAQERLFDTWPRLALWIAENRDDLFLIRRAELEAAEWEEKNYDYQYLWNVERLKKLQGIIQRLGQSNITTLVEKYAWPQEKLIESLKKERLSHENRNSIGKLLAALDDSRPGVGLSDERLPDIEWVTIPDGTVALDGEQEEFEIARYQVARYPVTNLQFQAFVDAADGYCNAAWWENLKKRVSPEPPKQNEVNGPRENVSWYEAIAFCRWLTQKYHERGILNTKKEVRLPTEWEWQQASTGGSSVNTYPWGPDWDESRCNSAESGLNRTTAVGLYLHGTWSKGPLDMSGNVLEWCLNKYASPKTTGIDQTDGLRVVRGGSWNNTPWELNSGYRQGRCPENRYFNVGFRLAQDL